MRNWFSRLQFHLATIAVSSAAGYTMIMGIPGKWPPPPWGSERFIVVAAMPAGYALLTWIVNVIARQIKGWRPTFLFLGERLLVAYLTFGLAAALMLLWSTVA